MSNVEIAYCLLLVLLFVMAISGLVIIQMIFNRLETNHPETWNELGKPHVIRNNSIGGNFSFLMFIWRHEFELLNDEEISRLCKNLTKLFLIYLIGLVVEFFLFISSFVPSNL